MVHGYRFTVELVFFENHKPLTENRYKGVGDGITKEKTFERKGQIEEDALQD